MEEKKIKNPPHRNPNMPSLSLIPLGGMEDVTKNMYVYEYKDEILIVDCGIGFADASMLGVDLLLPDITYLLQTKKKIVGMILSHGHEDHIGAVPYILPQLPPQLPVFASPFTAALTNEKLKEFKMPATVKTFSFGDRPLTLGHFTVNLLRITHSVPDSANIVIKTPAGVFYHGSDFKIDLTPHDKERMDFQGIVKVGNEGVLAMLTDSLGSDRPGHTPSEDGLQQAFENVLQHCKGKLIITTYSSNVARINQVIAAAERFKRRVCFVGRSLIKVADVAKRAGYLEVKDGTIIELEHVSNLPDSQVVMIVAGSQGQENSALTRIAEGEHREVHLTPDDIVIFSADPIPGNEEPVNQLIDTIAKTGASVITSGNGTLYHVSGHGSQQDHLMMMSLIKPRFITPISGNYKHLLGYQKLAIKMGYKAKDVLLLENGQEVIFSKEGVTFGRKIPTKNVYVDQVSGEEVEGFVLRDREKLAKDGIVILMIEINASDGQLTGKPDIIERGFLPKEGEVLEGTLMKEIKSVLSAKKGRVTNWVHLRKQLEAVASKHIFKKFRRRPLVLPVIIEV